MAFCTNCGKQADEGAKFCDNCGTPITQSNTKTERKTVFDGEIHKCPHCGNELKAFETICPRCEFEIRGTKGSSAVKDLEEKLEKATSEKQRIIIVKNFPVPNTKEDIFEFMLLASSNFDASYYQMHLHEEDISDAWLSKVEQCYRKAQFMLTKDEVENIEKMYFDVVSKISVLSAEKKKKTTNSVLFIVLGIVLMSTGVFSVIGMLFLVIGIIKFNSTKNKSEKSKDDFGE